MDDPLLEITVPMQFIIGENAVMTSLDDIEDFRERLTKTETSLIMVGGADDRLVVSNLKKRLECLTQSMVDRCVADEIYLFLTNILLKYNDELGNISSDGKSLFNLFNSSDYIYQSNNKIKKKSTKKRLIPINDDHISTSQERFDSNVITLKQPPKKKRAPPKSKSPLSGQISPLVIPNLGVNI